MFVDMQFMSTFDLSTAVHITHNNGTFVGMTAIHKSKSVRLNITQLNGIILQDHIHRDHHHLRFAEY